MEAAEREQAIAALETAIETIRLFYLQNYVGRSKDDPNRNLGLEMWRAYAATDQAVVEISEALERCKAARRASGTRSQV